jgi:hypothetical protein
MHSTAPLVLKPLYLLKVSVYPLSPHDTGPPRRHFTIYKSLFGLLAADIVD